jgi:hypothetical protein
MPSRVYGAIKPLLTYHAWRRSHTACTASESTVMNPGYFGQMGTTAKARQLSPGRCLWHWSV